MWWVVDQIAQGISRQFYEKLFSGLSVGQAIFQARKAISAQDDPALWASYIHYGDPRIIFDSSTAKIEKETLDAGAKTIQHTNPECETFETDHLIKTEPQIEGIDRLGFEMPLDDSARLVMVNAFFEQQEMQWPELSSIHMLMGMLHVPGGKSWQLLADSKIPAQQLVQTLRDNLKNHNDISNQEEKMQPYGGIRPNVSAMLTRAREIAERQGREAIGEPDLLEALLDMRSSGAYILLDFVLRKITRKSLGLLTNRSLKEKIFTGDGNLCAEVVGQGIIKALEQAVKESGDLNWSDIRSPHLALGVLARDDSTVAAYVLETGQSIKKLIARMRSDFQNDIPVNERPRLERHFFSENAIKYLMVAAEKAEMDGSSRVEEKHLWRAILEDVTGIFYLILVRQISPAALLPAGW
jgi:hypothetical protein